MPITNRNRMFSSIQNTDKNHGSFGYFWSDTAVITGSANPITGAWVPGTANPDGSISVSITSGVNIAFSGASFSVGNVAVTGGGTFTPTSAILTGSQQVINAGYKAASVAIFSGSAYINGVGPYLAGTTLSFGGYQGYLATAPLVVGCTGSTGSAACSTYVLWEV